MNYENENVSMIFMEYEEEINKAIKHYESELSAVRAGRANPHILDKILVDYYGTMTPIAHMANISVPEARQLLISPWDISNVKNISTDDSFCLTCGTLLYIFISSLEYTKVSTCAFLKSF